MLFRSATIEGGPTIATDGRIALRSLTVEPGANRIDVDAPLYMHQAEGPLKFDQKGTCLLISDTAGGRRPTVFLNEQLYGGEMPSVEVGGSSAFVVPLYGARLEDVLPGLAERCAAARKLLEPPQEPPAK